MKVTIFGTGYVGLVQAAVFAAAGHDVTCVDTDERKIDELRRGIVSIYEPGLERLVRDNSAEERLHFTTDPAAGVRHGCVQMIAVGTPPDEDGTADITHVLAVAEVIGREMATGKVVVSKSTVPIGTCDKIKSRIEAALSARGQDNIHCHVVANPEFLKEGSAVADSMRPDRIIVGTCSPDAEAIMRQLYAPFNRNHEKLVVMDTRSAELTKYAANCMLATKISVMNELALIADKLGADIEQVRLGIGSDPRIGYDFIYPGMGYGGSCFPKDIRALIRTAEQAAVDPLILRAVDERNANQKRVLFERIHNYFGGNLAGKVIALWGLAFKPNTNDMREAPSRALLEALLEAGANVRAYDPHAMEECRRIYGDRNGIVLCNSKEAALDGADVLAIATEWKSFRAPPFEFIRRTLRSPTIFDGRNLFDPSTVAKHGLQYFSIGRPTEKPDEYKCLE